MPATQQPTAQSRRFSVMSPRKKGNQKCVTCLRFFIGVLRWNINMDFSKLSKNNNKKNRRQILAPQKTKKLCKKSNKCGMMVGKKQVYVTLKNTLITGR